MSESVVRFNDAPLQIIDGDRGKNYPNGSDFSQNSDCLFLSARNVTKTGYQFDETSFISAEKDAQLRNGKLRRGDLVLTTRGTVGNVAYFDKNVPFEHMRINSGMVILRTDESRLDSRFLLYFLQSQSFSDQVDALTSGSAQPQLPIRDLNNAKLPMPNLDTQQSIAEVLGALDDKIAANTKLAATATNLVRAEFQSLMKSADKRATIGEVLSLEYGKSLAASKRVPGEVDVFGSGGIVGRHDTALLTGPGVIVGRKGTAGAVHWSAGPYFPIDTTYYVVPRSEDVSYLFAYFLLKSIRLDEMNSDSAVPGLNRNEAHAAKVKLPNSAKLQSFTSSMDPIFQLSNQSERENAILAATRDALLPQLMSGKLRVKEAEALVSLAV
ncbi:restriction endonuclease subunit S [Specibacter sp. RAF43]|uniref:restriction endonuclease subunit S n=1 Tax=Specibacter sp. RAF43 TaxID=3233057 RepID=UPI003F9CB3D6